MVLNDSYPQRSLKCLVPAATEMGKTVGKADLGVKKMSSVLDILSLKHLLDIQVKNQMELRREV